MGIDAEIIALIAEKLGMTAQVEDMEFDSIIPAVQSGKVVDVGMAGMTVTDERKQVVNFTSLYATGKQVIIVKEDSPSQIRMTLRAKRSACSCPPRATCTSPGTLWRKGWPALSATTRALDAVQALVQGKIDAVVIDNEPAKVFVSMNEGLKIRRPSTSPNPMRSPLPREYGTVQQDRNHFCRSSLNPRSSKGH